jgi:hypothetical protein
LQNNEWQTKQEGKSSLLAPSKHLITAAIYLRSQPDRKTTNPKPFRNFLHKECNKLMLLRRNEAINGLVSLRMGEYKAIN